MTIANKLPSLRSIMGWFLFGAIMFTGYKIGTILSYQPTQEEIAAAQVEAVAVARRHNLLLAAKERDLLVSEKDPAVVRIVTNAHNARNGILWYRHHEDARPVEVMALTIAKWGVIPIDTKHQCRGAALEAYASSRLFSLADCPTPTAPPNH